MKRLSFLVFAASCYAVFFATFLYLIGFVADVPVLSHTVDTGPSAPVPVALIIDIVLIAMFGVQHSVMARQGFKRAWTRLVPQPLERSVYVLMASAMLILMFVFWLPIAGDVWNVEGKVGAALLWALFAIGWLIVLLSTFLINHFELFGLQQAWFQARGRMAASPKFRTPFFYKLVRHPLYSGFVIAFWATPRMTLGHLLLAAGLSIYMLIAIQYEERDLVELFGDDYQRYRRTTGMLAPRIGKQG
ncbi:isoprenylcysteine carboxylmethyltransferase family protein [Sphingomonas panacisoli]|uniref:methanethiol S-methyltransferase n=1 Tax=Sphingomonas panacisoli TaxID=1813879 RepID=A0A5B8LGS6_9SPHN|nr:methanethiol S-methyltransferase [Sphingomonas panacisoli]QDZ06832.1 isoprenylcysteine carboxylmethyltransferase family protein [Sphingomonas panacisoli]